VSSLSIGLGVWRFRFHAELSVAFLDASFESRKKDSEIDFG